MQDDHDDHGLVRLDVEARLLESAVGLILEQLGVEAGVDDQADDALRRVHQFAAFQQKLVRSKSE